MNWGERIMWIAFIGNYPFDVGSTRCSVEPTGRRKAGAR